MKTCSRCKEAKDESQFGRCKWASDGLRWQCKSCRSLHEKRDPAYKRAYYLANRDDMLDKSAARHRKRWDNDPAYRQRHAVGCRQHREANPGLYAGYVATRRAARKKATPPWLTDAHRAAIQTMYDDAARLTRTTGIRHEVDHIHPLLGATSSGLHVPWNLQVLRHDENHRKSNKEPWRTSHRHRKTMLDLTAGV